mmetsp:Transcript_85484/g.133579  ORF Transcript_85484/g.133579 Transcript_85484/m.133579 type:complete len:159 (-) Transcript_85484:81-557(-)
MMEAAAGLAAVKLCGSGSTVALAYACASDSTSSAASFLASGQTAFVDAGQQLTLSASKHALAYHPQDAMSAAVDAKNGIPVDTQKLLDESRDIIVSSREAMAQNGLFDAAVDKSGLPEVVTAASMGAPSFLMSAGMYFGFSENEVNDIFVEFGRCGRR